ncbi:MAG: type 1 glutamine amidotransferase [Thiohalomonadaceae bacterium]
MHIHYLQHVPFGGPGSIENWAITHGHRLSQTRLYAADPLPALERFDLLIILGGPMRIHDDVDYPWLKAEKWFIQQVIAAGKPILGICLGAQLLADALGAEVRPQGYREIGWFPIILEPDFSDSNLGQCFPASPLVMHWHGESFSLPAGAQRIAHSAACANQGFIWQDRLVGLQFHLESTLLSTQALIDNAADELDGSQWVQSADAMLVDEARFIEINRLMQIVLAHLEAQARITDR